ncbi:CPBP family intramembrane metalloprotease [bacterium]|nr:CPBP family intramembrane metalloprotease [bacterium]
MSDAERSNGSDRSADHNRLQRRLLWVAWRGAKLILVLVAIIFSFILFSIDTDSYSDFSICIIPAMNRIYVIHTYDEYGALISLETISSGSETRRLKFLKDGTYVLTIFDKELELIRESHTSIHDGIKVDRVYNRAGKLIHEEKNQLMRLTRMTIGYSMLIASALVLLMLAFRRDMRLLIRFVGQALRWPKALLAVLLSLLVWCGCGILDIGLNTSFSSFCSFLGKVAHSTAYSQHIPWAHGGKETIYGYATTVLMVPLVEELLFRGVLFLIFLRLSGKWGAVFSTTLLFTLCHFGNRDFTFQSVWLYAVGGLLLAFLLLKTGRLRWCIFYHTCHNLLLIMARIALAPFLDGMAK